MDVETEIVRQRALLVQILANQTNLAHMLLHLQPEWRDPSKQADMALEIVRGTKNVLESP